MVVQGCTWLYKFVHCYVCTWLFMYVQECCFDSNVELFVKMLRQCAQLFDFEALASLGFQFVSCAFKCK